jgi:hypothetical protein
MRNSLEESIKELEKILNEAREKGICLNKNYLEDCSEKEFQSRIKLASMDIIFNYSRNFKNSQENFENSFDVIKDSIDLLVGSNLSKTQTERAREIVSFAIKQENPKLKIPYRTIEYLPGYI